MEWALGHPAVYIQKKLGIVNSAIQGGGQHLLRQKWSAHEDDKWYCLFEFMREKFVTFCIYDELLEAFCPVQLPQGGFETLHLSPLVLFLLVINSFFIPWEFNGMSREFVLWSSLRLNTLPCTARSKFSNNRATKHVRGLNFMYLKS